MIGRNVVLKRIPLNNRYNMNIFTKPNKDGIKTFKCDKIHIFQTYKEKHPDFN
jgi:hypothetical protein